MSEDVDGHLVRGHGGLSDAGAEGDAVDEGDADDSGDDAEGHTVRGRP